MLRHCAGAHKSHDPRAVTAFYATKLSLKINPIPKGHITSLESPSAS